MTKREELKEAIKNILIQLVKDSKTYLNTEARIDIYVTEIITQVEEKFFN